MIAERLPLAIVACCILQLPGCFATAQGYAPWTRPMQALLLQVQAETFPTNGLVSYWSMRTSGTTVYDEWGSNNATASTSSMFGTAYGVRDAGAQFNNVDRFISVSKSASLNIQVGNGVSFAAWIRLNNANKALAAANRDYVFSCTDGSTINSAQYAFFAHPYAELGTAMTILSRNSADTDFITYTSATSSAYLTQSNTWYHVAASMEATGSGGLVNIYFDGTLVHSATNSTAALTSGATTFFIGKEGSVNPRYADADFDELAIWNRALTSNEVYRIATTPLYYP
jgi:hypothetical protein